MDPVQSSIPPPMPPPLEIDPSSLTTQLVLREVSSLKELLKSDIASMQKAIALSHDDWVRVPTETQKAVGALQTLMQTKIDYESKIVDIKIGYEIRIKNLLNDYVNKNFERVENHRLEYKADSTRNIESALKSQMELNKQTTENIILVVSKNEAMFTKLIDSLGNTMNLGINNLRESISELKTFQSKDTGSKQGSKDVMDIIKLIIVVAAFLLGYFVIK